MCNRYVVLATAVTGEVSQGITISAEGIITFSAVLTALIAIFGVIFAVYRWYLHQNDQDTIIKNLQEKHETEIADLKKEQQLLTYGMLACLEGLKQLNCNGPVTDARDKLSKHLNAQAHKS